MFGRPPVNPSSTRPASLRSGHSQPGLQAGRVFRVARSSPCPSRHSAPLRPPHPASLPASASGSGALRWCSETVSEKSKPPARTPGKRGQSVNCEFWKKDGWVEVTGVRVTHWGQSSQITFTITKATLLTSPNPNSGPPPDLAPIVAFKTQTTFPRCGLSRVLLPTVNIRRMRGWERSNSSQIINCPPPSGFPPQRGPLPSAPHPALPEKKGSGDNSC